MLFAVVGAKLSEGINFADNLARSVVMVGLPFPNRTSRELSERMEYVRTLPQPRSGRDAGNELYLNLCMRAVNQSIGRAIRHRNDYAVFLLLDHRYTRKDILSRLPLCALPRRRVAHRRDPLGGYDACALRHEYRRCRRLFPSQARRATDGAVMLRSVRRKRPI